MRRIPGNTCIFTTNNDGRIISLSLENCWGTDNKGYVLPAIISSLEKMTELRLGICRSLPLELSNMPQLKTLRFFDSRILLSDFPGQLKQLGSKPLPFLTWITKQLPNLEGLGFKSLKRNELEFIIDSLRNTDNMRFQDSLRYLWMENCNLSGRRNVSYSPLRKPTKIS